MISAEFIASDPHPPKARQQSAWGFADRSLRLFNPSFESNGESFRFERSIAGTDDLRNARIHGTFDWESRRKMGGDSYRLCAVAFADPVGSAPCRFRGRSKPRKGRTPEGVREEDKPGNSVLSFDSNLLSYVRGHRNLDGRNDATSSFNYPRREESFRISYRLPLMVF